MGYCPLNNVVRDVVMVPTDTTGPIPRCDDGSTSCSVLESFLKDSQTILVNSRPDASSVYGD